MKESEHNSRIEEIAKMILSDNISLDTQEQNALKNTTILQKRIIILIKILHQN